MTPPALSNDIGTRSAGQGGDPVTYVMEEVRRVADPMDQPLRSVSVLRDDGIRGTIVDGDTPGQLIVRFDDGTSLPVAPDALVRQACSSDG